MNINIILIVVIIIIIIYFIKNQNKNNMKTENMTNIIQETIEESNIDLSIPKKINLPLKTNNFNILNKENEQTNPMAYLTSNNIYFPPSWIFKPFKNKEKPKIIFSF